MCRIQNYNSNRVKFSRIVFHENEGYSGIQVKLEVLARPVGLKENYYLATNIQKRLQNLVSVVGESKTHVEGRIKTAYSHLREMEQ